MKEFPDHIQKIIDYFVQFPGIGPRSSIRIISHLLHMQDSALKDFGTAINELKDKIKLCKRCFNLAEGDYCIICDDQSRNENTILVVEDILDLVAFERIGDYKGRYHILGGVISPLRGISPNDIRIDELVARVKNLKESKEIIIATNPNLEGEATAMYLREQLAKIKGLTISRIARGIPTGADIDYADDATLEQALNRRINY